MLLQLLQAVCASTSPLELRNDIKLPCYLLLAILGNFLIKIGEFFSNHLVTLKVAPGADPLKIFYIKIVLDVGIRLFKSVM